MRDPWQHIIAAFEGSQPDLLADSWPVEHRRRYMAGDGEPAFNVAAIDDRDVATDEEMLAAIYKIGRVSVAQMAGLLGVSFPEARSRLERLERLGTQGHLRNRFGWWHLSAWESRNQYLAHRSPACWREIGYDVYGSGIARDLDHDGHRALRRRCRRSGK